MAVSKPLFLFRITTPIPWTPTGPTPQISVPPRLYSPGLRRVVQQPGPIWCAEQTVPNVCAGALRCDCVGFGLTDVGGANLLLDVPCFPTLIRGDFSTTLARARRPFTIPAHPRLLKFSSHHTEGRYRFGQSALKASIPGIFSICLINWGTARIFTSRNGGTARHHRGSNDDPPSAHPCRRSVPDPRPAWSNPGYRPHR